MVLTAQKHMAIVLSQHFVHSTKQFFPAIQWPTVHTDNSCVMVN